MARVCWPNQALKRFDSGESKQFGGSVGSPCRSQGQSTGTGRHVLKDAFGALRASDELQVGVRGAAEAEVVVGGTAEAEGVVAEKRASMSFHGSPGTGSGHSCKNCI